MARFCPECAHPIREPDKPFCPACGARVPPSPGEGPPSLEKSGQSPRPEPPETSRARAASAPSPEPGTDERPFHYSFLFWAVIILDICISFFFGLVSAGNLIYIMKSGSGTWTYGGIFLLGLLILNLILDFLFLAREHKSPGTIDRRLCVYKSFAGILGVFTIIAGLYFLIISYLLYRSDRKAPDPEKQSFVFQKVCKGCGALIPADSSGLCTSCEQKNTSRTQPAVPEPEKIVTAASPAVPARSPEPVPEKILRETVPDLAGKMSRQPEGAATAPAGSCSSDETTGAGRTVPEESGVTPGQMTCRVCGTLYTHGDRYCSRCLVLLPGSTAPEKPPDAPPPPPALVRQVTPGTCRACGNILKPGDVYCDKCLVLIPPESRIEKPAPPPEPPDPYDFMNSRERRRYYLIQAGVLTVFLAGFVLFIAGIGIGGLNRTGIMPTFPFAGYITSFIGSLVLALSVVLERKYTGRLYAEVEQRIIAETRFRDRS